MIFLKPAYLILLLLETLLKLPWADGIKFKCDLRGPFPLALAYHLNLILLLFCVEFFFFRNKFNDRTVDFSVYLSN